MWGTPSIMGEGKGLNIMPTMIGGRGRGDAKMMMGRREY